MGEAGVDLDGQYNNNGNLGLVVHGSNVSQPVPQGHLADVGVRMHVVVCRS